MRLLQRLLPSRIGSQIAAMVVTSLLLANIVTTATIFFFLPLPPRLPDPIPGLLDPPGATISKLIYTARLLDGATTAATRADILRAARASFPELEEASAVPGLDDDLRDEGPLGVIRGELERELGDGFSVFAVPSIQSAAGQGARLGIQLRDGTAITAPMPVLALTGFSLGHPPAPGPGFSIAAGAGPVMLSARSIGPAPSLPSLIAIGLSLRLVSALVFVASVVALLSLWAARSITAPLGRFADAAERFTVGRPDQPLGERGPLEIRRMARALNEMRARICFLVDERTRMLAAIGHDLRTPITRLRLRAEEIASQPLRAQITRDLETMEAMVHAALSFLRDQAKAGVRERTDLSALVLTICDEFSDMGGEVRFQGPPHLDVDCDPDQLTRAVANLIDNGLKFGAAVSVVVRSLSDREVAVEVRDQGPGIPEAEKERAMEPFYRGDAARRQNGASSFGLGLSITRSVVESHGGRLELLDAAPGLLARLRLPANPATRRETTHVAG